VVRVMSDERFIAVGCLSISVLLIIVLDVL
jgi:hypothetical protein